MGVALAPCASRLSESMPAGRKNTLLTMHPSYLPRKTKLTNLPNNLPTYQATC